LPKDAVWGAGAGDQLLFVVPSLNLVMVRNGEALFRDRASLPCRPTMSSRAITITARGSLFEPLVEAVTNAATVNAPPRRSVIQEIRWRRRIRFDAQRVAATTGR
jgi:hypothetical protein